MSATRALCVGINRFAHLPESSWLNGCVNDAEDMARLLQDRWSLGDPDITILRDAEATKDAVIGHLTDLVDRTVTGELQRVVFSYSSHGTQVPDPSGDEADRADEALAAYDLRSDGDQWDAGTVIVDDELRALLDRLPAGVLFEAFLDTCHSGTGLRSLDLLPGRRPKFLPAPTPIGAEDLDERNAARFLDRASPTGTAGAPPVLLAACRADQTASDAYFDGRYNGAFTHHLLKRLKAEPTATRLETVTAVEASLRAGRFTQSPQLEAADGERGAPVGELG